MSKRVLLLTLAVLMAVGIYTAVANAGVEGDFTFDIYLYPQTTTNEVTVPGIDFEGLLNLSLTLSGLTFSSDLAIGIAGIEHYIATLTTTLGALDLKDEFAFAEPYVDCPYYYPPWYSDFSTTCHPVGPLLFVKKRVDLEITLGGLTFDTLVMFEDYTFPKPTDTGITSYTAEDQHFGFGTILSLSGATVSGIEITAKSGFNADWGVVFFPAYSVIGNLVYYNYIVHEYPTNDIKKHRWYETIVGGTWEFTKETLYIENIVPVEGITLNSYTVWEVGGPFTEYLNAEFSLAGIANVSAWFVTHDITTLAFLENAVIVDIGDNMRWLWKDINGNLYMDYPDDVVFQFAWPFQFATFSGLLWSEVGTGLIEMDYDIYIPVGDLYFEATVYFPGPPVTMDEWEFTIGGTVGGIDLTMYADFYMSGLNQVNFSVTIPFSA